MAAGPLAWDSGERSVIAHLRPRYESSNIRTWIGFKQFMQLAQEAVLGWFRERGFGPQRLFHEYGLGLHVLDSSVLLPSTLEVDDEVTAEVTRADSNIFTVRLHTGSENFKRVLRGKLTVALNREHAAEHSDREIPGELLSLLTPSLVPEELTGPTGTFSWSWKARYFHCHYSESVQHSSYVAALEEVVDRYLHAVGLPVPKLLAERGWIPVVSKARVTVYGQAYMNDIIHTTFTVDDIVAKRAFDGRMTCHIGEGDQAKLVAAGTILHGYAMTRGGSAGQLAELDEEMVEILQRGEV